MENMYKAYCDPQQKVIYGVMVVTLLRIVKVQKKELPHAAKRNGVWRKVKSTQSRFSAVQYILF